MIADIYTAKSVADDFVNAEELLSQAKVLYLKNELGRPCVSSVVKTGETLDTILAQAASLSGKVREQVETRCYVVLVYDGNNEPKTCLLHQGAVNTLASDIAYPESKLGNKRITVLVSKIQKYATAPSS